MYYTYMIRCEDNSIYTGITNNLKRRMNEHFDKTEKCAKYTLRHTPKIIETVWESENRTLASKLEYHIKSLKKCDKEEIIKENTKIDNMLSNKIECNLYRRIARQEIEDLINKKL